MYPIFHSSNLEKMPDLFTHITSALVFSESLSIKRRSILLLGSILPDAKVFLYPVVISISGLSDATAFIIPIHSPAGSLLLACFISSLFAGKEFKGVFTLLTAGVAIHFLLDAMMYPLSGIEHYLLLFPFSWSIAGVNLPWLTDYLAVFNLIILGFIRFGGKFNKKIR